MRVREIAKKVAVRPQVIRYYTRLGLLCPARDSRNGYNTYSDSEVIRLRFIHQAQSLGFTLSDIAQIFEDAAGKSHPVLLSERHSSGVFERTKCGWSN